jgi:hypothetical protein
VYSLELGKRLTNEDGFMLDESNITSIANGLFEAVKVVANELIAEDHGEIYVDDVIKGRIRRSLDFDYY